MDLAPGPGPVPLPVSGRQGCGHQCSLLGLSTLTGIPGATLSHRWPGTGHAMAGRVYPQPTHPSGAQGLVSALSHDGLPFGAKPAQRPRGPQAVGTHTKARMVTGPPEANFPRQPPRWLSPGDRGVPGASSMATSETPGPESRGSQGEGSWGRVIYPGPWAGRGEATADSPTPCPAGRGATVHPKPPCRAPSSRAQGVHGPPSGPSTLPVSGQAAHAPWLEGRLDDTLA